MLTSQRITPKFSSWNVFAACSVMVAAVLLCLVFAHSPLAKHKSGQSLDKPMLREDKRSSVAAEPIGTVAMDIAAPPPPLPASSLTMAAKMKMLASASKPDGPPLPPQGPMVARSVSMSLQVKDLAGARSALDSLLAGTRGYAAQLTVGDPEDGPRTLSASLRIPAPALDRTLRELKALGRTVNESQGGEEVTAQHEDLVARLKNARETEERYRAILLQRTGKVSDVLEVEEQISNVRGEIERMEAEQQGLEHRVAFASVDVQLTESYKAHLAAPANSISTQLSNAMVAGLGHVGDSLLGIVLFAEEYGPAILLWTVLIAGPAFLIWRRRKADGDVVPLPE